MSLFKSWRANWHRALLFILFADSDWRLLTLLGKISLALLIALCCCPLDTGFERCSAARLGWRQNTFG